MRLASRRRLGAVAVRALKRARELSASIASGPLPIPLESLAKVMDIAGLRFSPLLSTAGLMRKGEKWVIVLNTEGNGVEHREGAFIDVSESWDKLHAAVRFTVAHEIGHTIYSQASGEFLGVAESYESGLSSLEACCSDVARLLLVPGARLKRELEADVFNAEAVTGASERFRVSWEVLVRRLEMEDVSEWNANGSVILFRSSGEAKEIIASQAWGPLAKSRFMGHKQNRRDRSVLGVTKEVGKPTLEALQLGHEVDELLKLGSAKKAIRVPCGKGLNLPCELSLHTSSNGAQGVVAIKIMGELAKSL